jgi:hypothetical protein
MTEPSCVQTGLKKPTQQHDSFVLLLASQPLDLSPQLLHLVLQVPQALLSIRSTARSNPTRSGSRGWRSRRQVRILGRGVGAQVGHALDLEMSVARRAGFRPSGRLSPVALLEEVRKPILQVGRPVEPSAVIEHRPIYLTPRSRGETLHGAPHRLGSAVTAVNPAERAWRAGRRRWRLCGQVADESTLADGQTC